MSLCVYMKTCAQDMRGTRDAREQSSRNRDLSSSACQACLPDPLVLSLDLLASRRWLTLTALRDITQVTLGLVIEAPRLRLHATRVAAEVVATNQLWVVCCVVEDLSVPGSTLQSRLCTGRSSSVIDAITMVACMFWREREGEKVCGTRDAGRE